MSLASTLENSLTELRLAVRKMMRRPVFSLAVIATLGLAIGATATVFALVYGVLIKPLPYRNPDRLVGVFRYDSSYMGSNPTYASVSGWYSVPFRLYLDWTQRQSVFEALGAYRTIPLTLTGEGRPERLAAVQLTSGVFEALQVKPAIGRAFLAGEDRPGQPDIAVLSYALWQRIFAAHPAVLGEQIVLSGTSFTIVGVMPAGFSFPNDDDQVWVSFPDGSKASMERRGGNTQVLARLLPGVSFQEAGRAMDALAEQIHQAHPEDEDDGIRLVPRLEMEVGSIRAPLLLLMAAVGLVWLISCANIANLLLVRATERSQELHLRSALGAGRVRIAGQLVCESLILSLAGGLLGWLIAMASLAPFAALFPGGIPRLDEIGADFGMLAFTSALSVLTGLVMGILPALAAPTAPSADPLRGWRTAGSRKNSRAQAALVSAEVAMAFLLLAAAGLFLKSFTRLTAVDLGFSSQDVLTMRLALPQPYRSSDDAVRAFYQQLMQRLEGLPGVEDVVTAGSLPVVSGYSLPPTLIETAQEVTEAAVHTVSVTPDYFSAMAIPLRAGRMLTPTDRKDAQPVAVVSQSMARLYWPEQDPLGKRLKSPSDPQWRTVVGVVGDIRTNPVAAPAATIYCPFEQRPQWFGTIALKSKADPGILSNAMREAVWEVDPDLPVSVQLYHNQINRSSGIARPRFIALVVGTLAAAAALLAIVGIYGVLAYTVTQRSKEIGIRIALGAASRNVLLGVLRRGLMMAGVGLAAGLAAALAVGRLMRSLLFSVSPADAPTFALVGLIIVATALGASYLPARRATRVDPVVALRRD